MEKYKLYGLIDPRTKEICYIGITKSKLKNRLRQHNSPKKTNEAPIAKLARYLKNNNLGKLSIIQLDEAETKEEIFELEINTIKKYKENGIKLKNVQEGGQLTINGAESYKMARNTRMNNPNKIILRGSLNPCSLLNEEDVLNIYKLIKEFYTNDQIIEKLNLKIKRTVICAIRSGQNWQHLFKEHFNEKIPSLFSYDKNGKGGLEPRFKLLIINLIAKGYSQKHIIDKFPRIKSDFNRIKNKEIWKKAWEVYYKFYLPYKNEKRINLKNK